MVFVRFILYIFSVCVCVILSFVVDLRIFIQTVSIGDCSEQIGLYKRTRTIATIKMHSIEWVANNSRNSIPLNDVGSIGERRMYKQTQY